MSRRIGLRHVPSMLWKYPWEDLRKYVKVDPSAKIVVSGNGLRVTYTQVSAAYIGWLRKAKAFVGDYSIRFEVVCTGHRGNVLYNGDWYCLAVMNNATPELATYCGGVIASEALGVGPKLGIFQGGSAGQYPQVTQAINQDQIYYCTLSRASGTLTLGIYTDAARSVLLATLTSPTVLTTSGTQIFACNGDTGEESGWISGYTQKILIA